MKIDRPLPGLQCALWSSNHCRERSKIALASRCALPHGESNSRTLLSVSPVDRNPPASMNCMEWNLNHTMILTFPIFLLYVPMIIELGSSRSALRPSKSASRCSLAAAISASLLGLSALSIVICFVFPVSFSMAVTFRIPSISRFMRQRTGFNSLVGLSPSTRKCPTGMFF